MRRCSRVRTSEQRGRVGGDDSHESNARRNPGAPFRGGLHSKEPVVRSQGAVVEALHPQTSADVPARLQSNGLRIDLPAEPWGHEMPRVDAFNRLRGASSRKGTGVPALPDSDEPKKQGFARPVLERVDDDVRADVFSPTRV